MKIQIKWCLLKEWLFLLFSMKIQDIISKFSWSLIKVYQNNHQQITSKMDHNLFEICFNFKIQTHAVKMLFDIEIFVKCFSLKYFKYIFDYLFSDN
jgi:hypothetical protein